MPQSFIPATVFRIIDESHNVKRYFFRVNTEEPFQYKAGQFVVLNLPIDSKVKTRSYSIASPPAANNEFELCVVQKPGGIGTQYLWENIREGSTIEVSKALGKFALPDQIESELCFICTGTGIAPFMSMIKAMIDEGKAHVKTTLIFGSRYERDLIYLEDLANISNRLLNFKHIIVLSREEQWQGEKGYVHGVYEKLFEDRRPAYFYICGWHDMLHETRRRLESMGYDKQFIKFEAYD